MTMQNENGNTNWSKLLCRFGRKLLADLGEDLDYLSTRQNAIVEALKSPGWVQAAGDKYGKDFNRTSLSKIATICQMVVFDAIGGPERDRNPKALRRHWYQWYKVDFALPFSIALGEDPNDPRWGLNWAGRMSQTYAYFVDEMDVTYRELWVEDARRMISRLQSWLHSNAKIVVAVEKDSLFQDFKAAASAIGAACIISGKGKNSKAATEKMLRDVFGWSKKPYYNYDTGEYELVFSDKSPLYILHISDHDYDGQAVIGPTFGEQARRYTPHVLEARVGIKPNQLPGRGYSIADKSYQIKLSNTGYIEWAQREALFPRECGCGDAPWSKSSQAFTCENCGAEVPEVHVRKGGAPAYGLEVEAMRVADYSELMVHALLSIMPFEAVVQALRVETEADAHSATHSLKQDVLDQSETYQALLEEFNRLEKIKNEFEYKVESEINPIAYAHRGDFADEGDDPKVTDFVSHATDPHSWGPWRPFSIDVRTKMLVTHVRKSYADEMKKLSESKIDFTASLTKERVRDALSALLEQATDTSRTGIEAAVQALREELEL